MITIEINYAQPKLYHCQECCGSGYNYPSTEYCSWCDGYGEVDGPTKALWLNEQKKYKHIRERNGGY